MADWTVKEVELTIADYFSMLIEELDGKVINKSQSRKELQKLLNNRSDGSIEFKRQNISAVLINFGLPNISGYKRRDNYQKILEDKVREFIEKNPSLKSRFEAFSDREVKRDVIPEFEKMLVAPPTGKTIREPVPPYTRGPFIINYLEREQKNRSLGLEGEKLVVRYEKWRLQSIGKDHLADQVEWISKEQGDGAGFDILSKDNKGRDKYIEVKTTKLAKETPFYFSKNELDFSVSRNNDYHLYRLFNFERGPKMFIKQGSLRAICQYFPVSFKGYV